MTLTVIPQKPAFTGTAPNRLTQAQSFFSANADNMMSYMSTEPFYQNDVTDAMNTLANEVEQIGVDTQSASDVALSASNYAGIWSTLTGALAKYSSVSHNSGYWMLENDLADITSSEPSDSNADWSFMAFAGANFDGVVYSDPAAIGANPTAKIYPDGTIVGSTDNGYYEKKPNGELICRGVAQESIDGAYGDTGLFYVTSPTVRSFPIPFINTAYALLSTASAANTISSGGNSLSAATFSVAAMFISSLQISIAWAAIGRWK